MSDFEILTIVLMIQGIVLQIIMEYIKTRKK